MRLNFTLEIAAFVISLILGIATSVSYNELDLRDRIYVRMTRLLTVFLGLNVVSCLIVRNNIFSMTFVAEGFIYFSFFIMVWIWLFLCHYLDEIANKRNYTSVTTYLLFLFPTILNVIVLIINGIIHKVFDINRVDGNLQIVFNEWYMVPYILAGISGLIYVGLLFANHKTLWKKKQYVFYLIPLILLVSYFLQYRYKAVAILGFSYTCVWLLLYLYIYNYTERLDNLTRLPNGTSFQKMLDYRIGMKKPMAVAWVALNDFKRVNQEYGYNKGNLFLKEVSKYLSSVSGKNCIARYMGDNFAIILEKHDQEAISEWTDKVLARFQENWQVDKVSHKLNVCITVVQYPDMAESSSEILDLLNYLNAEAKKKKKSQVLVCDAEFKERMLRRARISTILKEITQDNKVYVKYQPILDVEENAYTRGEALFRLKDGLLGDIPPFEFFPIAEENGYVIEIGYVLIDKVCQYIKSFIDEEKIAPIISVNFSRQQIMAEGVEERITEILTRYGLETGAIAIELPEEVFATQYHEVKARMDHMAEKGFRFYLDGFGTGFLDLSRLMDLPFEIIKINKNMIREAENNDTIYLLVSAMTAVFEENGKAILGDGIESERLKEICDMLFMNYLQGYYFSEPISEEKAKIEFAKTDVVEKTISGDMIMDGQWNPSVEIMMENVEWMVSDEGNIDGLKIDLTEKTSFEDE